MDNDAQKLPQDAQQQANLDVLKDKLLSLGAAPEELDEIIQDVHTVVLQRVLMEYMKKVNDPELTELMTQADGTEEELHKRLQDYAQKHTTGFPPLKEERYIEIAEQTWKEYFDFMSNNQ
jgi:hypothetical protein